MGMLSCKGDEEESIMSACFPKLAGRQDRGRLKVICEMFCC